MVDNIAYPCKLESLWRIENYIIMIYANGEGPPF